MKLNILIPFLLLVLSLPTKSQTTFLKHDQLNSQGFVGGLFTNQKNNGNFLVVGAEKSGLTSTHLFMAEYGKLGNLINKKMLADQYTEAQCKHVIFLDDGSFWTTGQYADFSRLGTATYHYDSTGNILDSFLLEGSFESLYKLNDTLLIGTFTKRKWDSSGVSTFSFSKVINNSGDSITMFQNIGYYISQNNYLYLIPLNENKYYSKAYKYNNNWSLVDSVFFDEIPIESHLVINDTVVLSGRIFDTINPGYYGKVCGFNKNFNVIWTYVDTTISEVNFLQITSVNSKFPILLNKGILSDVHNWYSTTLLLSNKGGIKNEIIYKVSNESFLYSPIFRTLDNGFFGFATHWNSPYQFNIMKTDSLGRVFSSDYLGGVIFTGINSNYENKESELFILFPNPTSSVLYIQPLIDTSANYRIVNLTGDIVSQGLFSTPYIELNVSNFSKGVYIIQVYDRKKLSSKKFIVK